MNLVDDVDGFDGGALLIAHLNNLAVFFLTVGQNFAFAGVVATRFLHVHVLTAQHGHNGAGRVPMVGGGVEKSIHLFVGNDFADVVF